MAITVDLKLCKEVRIQGVNISDLDVEIITDSDLTNLRCGYDTNNQFFIVEYKEDDRFHKEIYPADKVFVQIIGFVG